MIVTVIGARPQFIKTAMLSAELKRRGIKEFIIHTGQHYDYKMNEIFFEELGLPGADINLNIGSGNHGIQTAEMLVGIEKILLERKGETRYVLLYGDTNSTLAGALAASKLNIPIIHVEAGLRSFNRSMPEEINRVIADHLSSLLFCSSETGLRQLYNEGVNTGVHIVGDIMLDTFNLFSSIASEKISFSDILPSGITDHYCLMTIHRPSNTDNYQNLQEIFQALSDMKLPVVWPIHPRNRLNSLKVPANVHLLEPVSYFEMLVILKGCDKVITDSGGLQKEAYWAKKPCITVRTETEWVETTHHYWNIITGPDKNKITEAFNTKIDKDSWQQLYGDGTAAKKIADIIGNLKNGIQE